MQATRARREAAVQALAAARRAVASEVRSAFFDLEQADRVLETETKNVQAADESLRSPKAISLPDWEHSSTSCKPLPM